MIIEMIKTDLHFSAPILFKHFFFFFFFTYRTFFLHTFMFHTISSAYVLAVFSLTPCCKRRRRKDLLIIVVRLISFAIHRTWHLLYSRYTKYISPSSITNRIIARKMFVIDIWKRISSVFASLLPAAFWITKVSSLDCCFPMVVDYTCTHVKFVITINLH